MNVEHFKEVLNFCLVPSSGGTATHSVIPERLSIYTHMLQWYKCCIEHTPYMPVTPPPRRNSGSDSSSDDSGSGSPVTQLSVTYYSCNKEEIIDEMTQVVQDLERHRLMPQKSVQRVSLWHTRLSYYRRVCHFCLNGSTRSPDQLSLPQCTVFSLKPSHYVNLGAIKKRFNNGCESYHFNLKRVNQDWFLEMYRTQQAPHSRHTQMPVEEEMHFEGGGETRYQCVTSVEMLSAKATERQTSQTALLPSLSSPLHLCNLTPHKPKHCYVGKCDNCRNKQPLYIIICRVDIHRSAQQSNEMEIVQQ
jgi:hypothetical protein